jgi:hypothetical protein
MTPVAKIILQIDRMLDDYPTSWQMTPTFALT